MSTETATLVVFHAGPQRLGFNALHVRSMTAGELWAGETPLQVGALLGVGPGLFERRTRVLELETSHDEAVPVLARGEVTLTTVDKESVQPATVEVLDGINQELADFVDAVVTDESGSVLVVAPDAVHRFRLSLSEPPLPSSLPPAAEIGCGVRTPRALSELML